MDDLRFATARAEALAGRGYGDDAIRTFLEAEGAPVDAAEAGIAALEPEADRAKALVARLGSTPRVAAQLQRKGFGLDALESALEGGFADGSAGA